MLLLLLLVRPAFFLFGGLWALNTLNLLLIDLDGTNLPFPCVRDDHKPHGMSGTVIRNFVRDTTAAVHADILILRSSHHEKEGLCFDIVLDQLVRLAHGRHSSSRCCEPRHRGHGMEPPLGALEKRARRSLQGFDNFNNHEQKAANTANV